VIDAEQRQPEAAGDRTDVDDHTVALLAHGRQEGAVHAVDAHHVHVQLPRQLIRSEGLGQAHVHLTSVIDDRVRCA
jgi:hypothetical protein